MLGKLKAFFNIYGRLLALGFLVLLVVMNVFLIFENIPREHYYFSAPDGIYEQKEWGYIINNFTEWSFSRCEHDYLGALHGNWIIAPGALKGLRLEKVNEHYCQINRTAYGDEARLFLKLESNIIIDAWVWEFRKA